MLSSHAQAQAAARKRRAAGVKVGSGVASGGQNGRPKWAVNGVGGAKGGGPTSKASHPKPQAHAGPVQPSVQQGLNQSFFERFQRQGGNAHNFGGLANFVRSGAKGSPHAAGLLKYASWLDLQAKKHPWVKGGPAPDVSVGSPPASTETSLTPDFTAWRDAQYLDDERGLHGQIDAELNPVLSEMENLSAKGISGKTMYEALYSQAQGDFGKNVLSARDDASKRGLLVSGAFDNTRRGLNDSFASQSNELYNKYGQGRISALDTLKRRLEAQRVAGLADLQRAATARGREWWQGRVDNQYDEASQGASSILELLQQFGAQ